MLKSLFVIDMPRIEQKLSTIHILINISRSKAKQVMEFGNIGNIW